MEAARAAEANNDPLAAPAVPFGFRSVFTLQPLWDLGPMATECESCAARHWLAEADPRGQFELCCKKGDAMLDYLQPSPPVLRSLLDGTDHRSTHFRESIRAYNSTLAFTSVSYTKDTRTDLTRGLHCFQIHGELYHYQGPLIPGSQETPAFAQLFFYDPDYATDLRARSRPGLDRTILRDLHEMLADHNPFIAIHQTARERLRTQEGSFRLLLNPQMRLVMQTGADRRRENLPMATELAGILPDEFTDESSRDVLLAVREPGRNGPQLHRVNVTSAAYMPLHYVLLFPHGEHGWHYGLELLPRSRENVLCVASTGIAALLRPYGRTSHSQFKIPIELHEWSACSVTKQS